jgi:hypothetical protein
VENGLFYGQVEFHRGDYAVAGREELGVEVGNILGKEVGETRKR